MKKSNTNLVWQNPIVLRNQRERQNNHRSGVLWFTGLSGAGKSTLARAVELELHALGMRSYVLDGDNVRHGLCADLGFSDQDRSENIRRIGETSKLFMDAGCIVLCALISPFREDRERVRALFENGDFLEVYCRCELEVCEQRDVKGLYRKARSGLVKNFTGISSPYEAPQNPELCIDTDQRSLEESVQKIMRVVQAWAQISENAKLAADG